MHLPEPSVPEAGQKLAYYRLSEFVRKKCDVTLISFANEREKKYVNFDRYLGCSSVKIIYLTNIARMKNVLRTLLWLPVNIGARSDVRVERVVRRMLEENNDVTIHIEYEQGIACVPKEYWSRVQLVVHDVISQSLKRFRDEEKNIFKRFYLSLQLKYLIRWEKNVFSSVKEIIVLNEKDKKIIHDILPGEIPYIKVEYPLVSDFFYSIKRDRYNPKAIMFWGAMNRKENIDAVMWFVNSIFPIIKASCPDVVFYIVGANPTSDIESLSSDNIIVTGFVDSPEIYFEMAAVSVVPLRFGAGIKIKVLEALAANIPVISTDVGAEGIIDGRELLFIENNETRFANKVLSMLA